jgi:hypothetical protein
MGAGLWVGRTWWVCSYAGGRERRVVSRARIETTMATETEGRARAHLGNVMRKGAAQLAYV